MKLNKRIKNLKENPKYKKFAKGFKENIREIEKGKRKKKYKKTKLDKKLSQIKYGLDLGIGFK